MSVFNWKIIEEKPDNYLDVRLLIEDAVPSTRSENETVYLKQPVSCLRTFVEYFELQKFFTVPSNTVLKSNKDIIRSENEKRTLVEDFKFFSLDIRNDQGDLFYQLKHVEFKLEISVYFYFFWWGISILRALKEKKKISAFSIIDVTLSMNKIISGDFFQTPYKEGFDKLNTLLNRIISERFLTVFFENPKLLYHCSFQKFRKNIKLFPEQRQVLDLIHESIINDQPLLLANQMPTGHGKTFLSIPLAKMISMNRNASTKKTVLFACSNPLVNMDVAQNSLVGNDIHLWLAKMVRFEEKKDDPKPDPPKMKDEETSNMKALLRPYKRCFPSIWKQVYKKKEDEKFKNGTIAQQWYYYSKHTGKTPDIIVADLDACLSLLKHQEELDFPFICYIDEFISDTESNKIMVEICQHLPKQTVLLSSVLPKFENIPSVVSAFCERHSVHKDECCHRVSTADVNIPCCVIDPKGYVRFPHHMISSVEDLDALIIQVQINPRIRRTYSPKYVFFWSKSVQDILPEDIHFWSKFSSIGAITPKKVINYVSTLLEFLQSHFEHLARFQEYRPNVMNAITKEGIFTDQSWEYDPKTLVVLRDPMKETLALTETLFKDTVKICKLLESMEKKKSQYIKNIKSLQTQKISTKSKKNGSAMDKIDRTDQLDELEMSCSMVQLEIPTDTIINHRDHFIRFHSKDTPIPKNVGSMTLTELPDMYLNSFSDEELYQIFSGIGVYDGKMQTEYQQNLIMRIYHNLLFFNSGKEIVYGTNLANLTNIFLDKDFVDTINVCELYQLMGRIGRMGRSYNANIITCDEEVVRRCLALDDSFEKENEIEMLFSSR